MQRVVVAGISGSGKSTFARALAERLGGPYVELDSIYHQADWQPLPLEQFRGRVTAALEGACWVVDGNYAAVRDLIWARVDTVVWFDLPRPVVMRQLAGRTLRRMATRQLLWNGNREQWRNLLSPDPDRNILLFAWRNHARRRAQLTAAISDPANADLTFIRIGSHAQSADLLAGLLGLTP